MLRVASRSHKTIASLTHDWLRFNAKKKIKGPGPVMREKYTRICVLFGSPVKRFTVSWIRLFVGYNTFSFQYLTRIPRYVEVYSVRMLSKNYATSVKID